jgi:hypothetical protein
MAPRLCSRGEALKGDGTGRVDPLLFLPYVPGTLQKAPDMVSALQTLGHEK